MTALPFRSIFSARSITSVLEKWRQLDRTIFYAMSFSRAESSEQDREALKKLGYTAASGRYIAYGGGGYAEIPGSRLLIGGDGGGGKSHYGEKQASGYGGGHGSFQVGYAMPISKRVRFYPLLGIGGGSGGITYEADPANPKNVPKDPKKRGVWTGTGPMIFLGVGFEVTLGGKWGLTLGVRVGYAINPFRGIKGRLGAATHAPFIRFYVGPTIAGKENSS